MDDQTSQRKRVRENSSEVDSPEVKKLRQDLLDLLDDSDAVTAGIGVSDTHDLYSVMRSFEQELSGGASPPPAGSVADLTSDSGESVPDLGYLLEAAGEELGLPAVKVTTTGEEEEKCATELIRVSSESSRLGELWPCDEGITGYDSFELGIGDNNDEESGYVALDGMFDYSDVKYGPSDCKDISWGPERLSTL